MAEDQSSESLHDRRITWGLMAIVLTFVLLMTCIILWITTSLIRNERGSSDQSTPSPSNTRLLATKTPEMLTDTPILLTDTPTITPETPQGPILVDASWTPVPKRKFVKFVYWYVKPNQITVGECVQLHWKIEYAASLELYRDGELILENPPPNTTLQDCPTKLGYVVYRMVGTSSAGVSNWIQLQVRVKEAP